MSDRFTPIHNEVLEGLAKINLSPYEWRVLMVIFRKTYGFVDNNTGKRKKMDWIAFSQISEITGLKTPLISRALSGLVRKKVISRDKKHIGFSKEFMKQKLSEVISKEVISIDNKKLSVEPEKLSILHKELSVERVTKETSTKETCTNVHAEGKPSAVFFKEVSTYYITKFQERFRNEKPAINFGKDNVVVSRARGLFANASWRDLIDWFLKSDKAKEFGYSLSICFSAHTINQWKVSKSKKTDAEIDAERGVK